MAPPESTAIAAIEHTAAAASLIRSRCRSLIERHSTRLTDQDLTDFEAIILASYRIRDYVGSIRPAARALDSFPK